MKQQNPHLPFNKERWKLPPFTFTVEVALCQYRADIYLNGDRVSTFSVPVTHNHAYDTLIARVRRWGIQQLNRWHAGMDAPLEPDAWPDEEEIPA